MDHSSVSQGPATKCTVRDSLSGSLQPSPWLQSHASTCNLVSRASKYDISSEIRSILLLSTDPVRQLVAQIADLNVIHAVQISGASAPGGTKSAPDTINFTNHTNTRQASPLTSCIYHVSICSPISNCMTTDRRRASVLVYDCLLL